MKTDIPGIAVLMATRNGLGWLPEQIDSVLGQRGVDVTIWVSDDASSDGTREWLQEQSQLDGRIKLLPRTGVLGSAAKNFFRLVREAGWQGADYIAFADQDDIWLPDKLKRHSVLLAGDGCMAVSSSVIACWPQGATSLISKAQAQTAWDFVFESPGPGCTYLMKPELVLRMKSLLEEDGCEARQCALHDWLVYAICRAQRMNWYIDPEPSVMYRQHEGNEFGAHVGMKAAWTRLKKTAKGWHREEARKIVSSVLPLATEPSMRAELLRLQVLLADRSLYSRLRLLGYVARGRRRLTHRIALGLMVAGGIW